MSKNSFYYISKFIPFKNTVVPQSLSGIGHLDPMQIPINFFRCLNPLYYKKLTVCSIYHIYPSILLCLNNLQYLINYKCCLNNSYTILLRECSQKVCTGAFYSLIRFQYEVG